MSFNIDLMYNASDRKKLDKDLTLITTVTGTLKEPTSIIDPTITIQCNLATMKNCNYMYISTFNRYYYIDNIRSISNSLVEFSGHVDVLKTYATEIRGNSAIVKKQENRWNLYLNDGSFKIYQNPQIATYTFPYGFTTQEFVLAVAGG